MGCFGGWRGRKDGSSTKWGVSVDGEGERTVRPPNGAFWWMARAKGRFVHEMGRFGGWRGRKDGSSTKWGVLVDGEGEVAGEARSATKRKIVEKTLQGW